MTRLVLFLEELSAQEMLKGLLPRILPIGFDFQCVVFEGKQDLERQLGRKLRAWGVPKTLFIVIRDQDSAECTAVKKKLVEICRVAGKPQALVRIVCHELESWYLADLAAVEQGLGINGLQALQKKKKFRAPDNLAKPSQELKRLTDNAYHKISGSRAIGPHLSLGNQRSTSFKNFVAAVKKLTQAGNA